MHISYVTVSLGKQWGWTSWFLLPSLPCFACWFLSAVTRHCRLCCWCVCPSESLLFRSSIHFGFCWVFFSTVVSFYKCNIWQKAFGVAFTNTGVIYWLVNTVDWQLTSTVFSCCAFQLEITSRAASSSDVKDLVKKCQLSAWFLVCSALT